MLIPLRSLHTYIFLRSSLSLSRETYSIGLSIFFRFHSPVRYTISRYLIAHMISGSSTSRRNTRTRPLLYPEHWRSSPSLLFDGPRSNTVSPSRFLAYHLNNANDWMGLEPRNPNEITFIVITIRHYAPRSTGVGGHTSAEIFTLLESLFSITSVSIFVSLFLSILNLSALIEKNSPVYAYAELGIIILW